MDILIDTHILIWFQENNELLERRRMSLLIDPANQIFVSQVSLMELAIKYKLNKLPGFIVGLPTIVRQIVIDGFTILPIREAHLLNYQQIPLFEDHRDPFDRFLVATAISESMVFMTADRKFEYYNGMIEIV
ncbi:MAG: type II toxin-antitoxin system VapC family toxin [Bacteroidetes bacterium]|nr:type II toxin-antitoxin system VapC family toxin [Bacteroidota bacterium]